jgi:hypothetical protein
MIAVRGGVIPGRIPETAINGRNRLGAIRLLLALYSHEWTVVGGAGTGMVSAGFFLNSAKPWTKT